MFAAAIGHEAISSLLLQAGSDINTTDINGRTPLVNAAAGGSLTLVQILLDMKADPAWKDKYGRNAEYEANKRGHRNFARALLCSTGGENILLSGAKGSKRSRGRTFGRASTLQGNHKLNEDHMTLCLYYMLYILF